MALGQWRKSGGFLESFLEKQIKQANLDTRDSAFAQKITQGVLQNRNLLDFYIGHYSSMPTTKIQPPILDILRLSAYQMIFLDKVPHSAAVNEGVSLAKGQNPKAAGFVNAVLRRISEHANNLPKVNTEDKLSYLSTQYSHPTWFITRMLHILGDEETQKLLSANNIEPPIYAQVNTLKTDMVALQTALEHEGINPTAHPWLDNCLLLSNTGNLQKIDLFQKGHFYIQDPAARLAIEAFNPKPGMRILDACSAPGGKSFATAIKMGNLGEILSSDINKGKLPKIEEGANRLGISILQTKHMDAKTLDPETEGYFDGIIVDAPCSGLGIIRKKPEVRYKEENDILNLPAIQLDILRKASTCLKPGGALLYATCTILPEENEEVVAKFLAENPAFSLESFTLPGEIGKVAKGYISLYPHKHQTDGFFIARLRKEEEHAKT